MNSRFFSFIVFIAACLAYFKSWSFGFVFDDYLHIILEERIRNLDSSFFAFWEALSPGNLYRPILILSYSLTYYFVGHDPALYHATNILMHAINAVMVYYLLQRLVTPKISLLISLIFAVHPICSEAVANISGRSELLVHFFGLSTLLLTLRYLEDKFFINKILHCSLIFISFCLALFSKESALNYLAILILIYLYVAKNKTADKVKILILYCLAITLYMTFRIEALGMDYAFGGDIDFVDNPLIYLDWITRLKNALYLLGYYLMLLLLPFRMSADYSYAQFIPILTLQPEQWAIIISLIVIFIGGLIFSYQRDVRGFFIMWFFAAFAITSNILSPIGTVFADRLTYLPSIGLIGFLVTHFAERVKGKITIIAAGILFLTYFAITYNHINVWRSNLTLWEHQLKVAPLSYKAAGNYGSALVEEKRYAEAIPYLEEAIVLMPGAAMPKILLKKAKEGVSAN